MITEIVTFKLPDGTKREEVISNYEKTAPTWRENPDLIRKNYLFMSLLRSYHANFSPDHCPIAANRSFSHGSNI